MTRKELQDALRPYKAEYNHIKLNAKTEVLQAWWNEVNGQLTIKFDDAVSEQVNIVDSKVGVTEDLKGQVCELTSAVRLPQVLDLQFFEDNYSCELPTATVETVNYWEVWDTVYQNAVSKLKSKMPVAFQTKTNNPTKESNESSFGAVLLTIASIFLDCFATMYKAVTRTASKRRTKALGFA